MIIKGLKPTILIKSTVIVHTVNSQYTLIAKVINVNCKY